MLLCPLPEEGEDGKEAQPPASNPPLLPPALLAVASEFALTPRPALVPAHPPPNMAALGPGGAWEGSWPAATRRADQRVMSGTCPEGTPAAPGPPANAAAFLALARKTAAGAGVGNAAVVVDPSGRNGGGEPSTSSPASPSPLSSFVVAAAADARAAHPLRHAVMDVLGAVAVRDLERWPADGPPTADK